MTFKATAENAKILRLIPTGDRDAFINCAIDTHSRDNARWIELMSNPEAMTEIKLFYGKPPKWKQP